MKKWLLPSIAILLVGIGIGSYVYLHYHTPPIQSTNTLSITGAVECEFDIEWLYDNLGTVTVTSGYAEDWPEEDLTGIPLSEIIIQAGLEDPESYQYTIRAANYEKTVYWDDMAAGVLRVSSSQEGDNPRAIFPDLPRAIWVKNVVAINITGIGE